MVRRNWLLAVAIIPLAVLRAGTLPAQDEVSEETPPAVARLSVIDGEASLLRGDATTSWVDAAVNTPLSTADAVYAGPDSRVEIQLDHNNVLRLAEQTQIRIANLDSDQIQIEISQGLIDFAVLRDSGPAEGSSLEPYVEIDTPNVAVRPLVSGVYRVQVDSDSQAVITVRKGRAEVFTDEGSTTVEHGKTITVQGTDSPEYQIVEADSADDWDRWNRDRDHAILESQSWQYANRYYTGAGDLDAYGEWVEVPGYNWCWTPRVDSGWIPYALGHWIWEPYWGWTWISSEPWGWAPYHYGRWFWQSIGLAGRWVWWPGPRGQEYRPVYAPAYVAFLGFGFGGHNFTSGYGYGYQNIGWLALGPSDDCYPWWGGPRTYQTGTFYNATNTMHVRRMYEASTASNLKHLPALATAQQPRHSNLQSAVGDARVRGSIITIAADAFVKGQPALERHPMDLTALRGAQVVSGTLPVAPTNESLRPVERSVRSSPVPAARVIPVHFFTKAPSPAGPPSFKEDAAEISRMIAHPSPPAANAATTPATRVGKEPRPAWKVSGSRPAISTSEAPTFQTVSSRGTKTVLSPSDSGKIPSQNSSRTSESGKDGLAGPLNSNAQSDGARPGWNRFTAAPARQTMQGRFAAPQDGKQNAPGPQLPARQGRDVPPANAGIDPAEPGAFAHPGVQGLVDRGERDVHSGPAPGRVDARSPDQGLSKQVSSGHTNPSVEPFRPAQAQVERQPPQGRGGEAAAKDSLSKSR